MLPYWDTVIHPFLSALGAGTIIEIGSASGETTARLAEFAAAHELELHAVDPAPEFDVAELEQRYADRFHFHEEKSHDALETIGAAAAVLIDGDHNWYTVHGELTRLEKIAASSGQHFPLVILHDVEWPYARRDMYYDPSAIPDGRRKPWAHKGIRWGERLLDEEGRGVNSHFANAIEEGGPGNGVLTAIEDFMEDSSMTLHLRIVRGAAGIGILTSPDLLAANPALRRQWDRLHSTEFLLDHMKLLSEIAMRNTAGRMQAITECKRLRQKLNRAKE